MNGRYLLDTNILIGLFDGEVTVREQIATAAEVWIPSPTLGELYFGAYRSKQADKNVARIDDLARSYSILVVDGATANIYGLIRHRLRSIGKPIPENDIWIAALAQQWSATLATRDDHFDSIETIHIEKW